jgi:hypothetical protein
LRFDLLWQRFSVLWCAQPIGSVPDLEPCNCSILTTCSIRNTPAIVSCRTDSESSFHAGRALFTSISTARTRFASTDCWFFQAGSSPKPANTSLDPSFLAAGRKARSTFITRSSTSPL